MERRRLSVWERLGPPASPPPPGNLGPAESPPPPGNLGLPDKAGPCTRGGRTVQVHASSSSQLTVVVAGAKAAAPPGATGSALPTPALPPSRPQARVAPSRLLLRSLHQAQQSVERSQLQSPRSICSSRPSRVQGGDRPIRAASSSNSSSGRQRSRGPCRGGAAGTALGPQLPSVDSSSSTCSGPGARPEGGEVETHAVAGDCRTSEELRRRLEQLQAERRVAEELAEQMMLQTSTLMAEKARVQAENSVLHKERDHLLERLEYMEQVSVGRAHEGGASLSGSPVKRGAQHAQALQEQLLALQQEREELLVLLEAGLGGLRLQQPEQG